VSGCSSHDFRQRKLDPSARRANSALIAAINHGIGHGFGLPRAYIYHKPPFRLRLQQTPSSSHAVRLNPRTVISLGAVHRLLAPAEYKTKLCAGSPFNPPVPRAPSPVASARRAPSLLPSPCRRAISSWSSSIKACKWSGSIATTRGSCLGSLLCAGGLDCWAISRRG
jgi:hypothetical protein